jgi:hypothetical protein
MPSKKTALWLVKNLTCISKPDVHIQLATYLYFYGCTEISVTIQQTIVKSYVIMPNTKILILDSNRVNEKATFESLMK